MSIAAYVGLFLLLWLWYYSSNGKNIGRISVCFFFSLGMALGNSPYSPFWPVFHFLGGGYFHFSTRSFLISVFFIAMVRAFIVLFGSALAGKISHCCFYRVLGVVFVIAIFLPSSHRSAVMVTNARQYHDFEPSIPFSQRGGDRKTALPFWEQFHDGPFVA